MKLIQAVIWDMDGVLVDTAKFHFQAWIATLNQYNIDFSWDMFQKTFGMNNTGLLEVLLGYQPENTLVEEIADAKEAKFRELIRGTTTLIPEVQEWLIALRQMGIKQAVASSAPQENIDQILKELNIKPFFSIVLSAEKMPGKPNPDVFLETAKKLNVNPINCLVIEDSIAGVLAAKNAGMFCLAVTNTNSAESLSNANMIVDKITRDEYLKLANMFTI